MIAVVCLDEQNGVLFNGRRVSRDRTQRADLLALCGEKKLWLNSFSAKLFAPYGESVVINDAFLQLAGKGEFCFVENRALKPWVERLEGVILYRWNRIYPSDVLLDLDLTAFVCEDRWKFAGHSHEIITREIYIKK